MSPRVPKFLASSPAIQAVHLLVTGRPAQLELKLPTGHRPELVPRPLIPGRLWTAEDVVAVPKAGEVAAPLLGVYADPNPWVGPSSTRSVPLVEPVPEFQHGVMVP